MFNPVQLIQQIQQKSYRCSTRSFFGTLYFLAFPKTSNAPLTGDVTSVCFLQKDLIHTIGESAALGAAGFVIWGDLNLTSSRVGVPQTLYVPDVMLNPAHVLLFGSRCVLWCLFILEFLRPQQ